MHKDVLREFKSCLDGIETTLDNLVKTSGFLASEASHVDSKANTSIPITTGFKKWRTYAPGFFASKNIAGKETTSDTMIHQLKQLAHSIDGLINCDLNGDFKSSQRAGSPTSVRLKGDLHVGLLSNPNDYEEVIDPYIFIDKRIASLLEKIAHITSSLKSLNKSGLTNLKKEMKGTTQDTKVFSSLDIAVNSKVSSFVKACIGVEEEQSESVIRTTFEDCLDGASLVICREKLIRAKESIKALEKVDEKKNNLGPNR